MVDLVRLLRLPPRWLFVLGLSVASLRPHPDWPEVKAWVRREFPSVERWTVEELAARLADASLPAPFLLDARQREEFDVSHLPGAHWAPDVERALRELRARPAGAPVVVYCSVGYRSGRLARELTGRGVPGVRNLEGSLFEWANQGRPLASADGPAHCVHPFDEEWGRLLLRPLWPPGW